MQSQKAAEAVGSQSEKLRQARKEIEQLDQIFDAQISDLLDSSEVTDFAKINLLIDRRQSSVDCIVKSILSEELNYDCLGE